MNDKNSDELYRLLGLRSLRTAVKIPKCSVNSLKGKAVVTVADLMKKRRRKAYETGADEIR